VISTKYTYCRPIFYLKCQKAIKLTFPSMRRLSTDPQCLVQRLDSALCKRVSISYQVPSSDTLLGTVSVNIHDDGGSKICCWHCNWLCVLQSTGRNSQHASIINTGYKSHHTRCCRLFTRSISTNLTTTVKRNTLSHHAHRSAKSD
jgi:hypothetical protein